jgi:hypothetical protein
MTDAHVHLRLHEGRAADLQRAAAEHRRARPLAPPGLLARLRRRPAPAPEPAVTPALLLPPRPRRAPATVVLPDAAGVPTPRRSAESLPAPTASR